FEELFEHAHTRYEVVVTFLALLEMTKLSMTRIDQADPQSTLLVHYALLDEAAGDGDLNVADPERLDILDNESEGSEQDDDDFVDDDTVVADSDDAEDHDDADDDEPAADDAVSETKE
ncbi:MAG: Segregation and condensation protein ScpA, partial [Pseudomonadota bacterium]